MSQTRYVGLGLGLGLEVLVLAFSVSVSKQNVLARFQGQNYRLHFDLYGGPDLLISAGLKNKCLVSLLRSQYRRSRLVGLGGPHPCSSSNLSVGFVLVFSAFRALQNLQTSVHAGRVGALVLTLVHGLALATGLLGPLVVSRLGPRWSIALAAVAYPLWIACNLCVTGGIVFYLILLTSSALVGVAQSVAWSGQVCTLLLHFFVHKAFKLLFFSAIRYDTMGYCTCTQCSNLAHGTKTQKSNGNS